MEANSEFLSEFDGQFEQPNVNGNFATNYQLSPVPKRVEKHAVRRQYCNRACDQQQTVQFQQPQRQPQQWLPQQRLPQQHQPQQRQSQQQQPQQRQPQQHQPKQRQPQYQSSQQPQQPQQQSQQQVHRVQDHQPVRRNVNVNVVMNEGNPVKINRNAPRRLNCQEKKKETVDCTRMPVTTLKNGGIATEFHNGQGMSFTNSCMWCVLAQLLTLLTGIITSPFKLRRLYNFPDGPIDFIVFDSSTDDVTDSVGINHLQYLRDVCDDHKIRIDIYIANHGNVEGSVWIGKPAISILPVSMTEDDIDELHTFSILNLPNYHYELIVSKTATTMRHNIPEHYIKKMAWELKSYKMYPEKPKNVRNKLPRNITIPSMQAITTPPPSLSSIPEQPNFWSAFCFGDANKDGSEESCSDDWSEEIKHEEINLTNSTNTSPRVIPARVPQNIHEQIERVRRITTSLVEEISTVQINI